MKPALAVLAALLLAHAGTAQAATLHVSPAGSDAGACTALAPCGSVDRAFRVAAPGDIVEVGAGTYGEQVVPAVGRGLPKVEIRPAPNAVVTVNGMSVRGDNVIVRGMTSTAELNVGFSTDGDFADNVELYDMHARQHFVLGARDMVWKGGSIGPIHDDKNSMIGGTPTSHRLTYDGIHWHDGTRSNANVHMECLLALGVQGLTIRNSRFSNCAVFDVFISKIGSDPVPRDIVLENNVFEASKDVDGSDAYYSVMTGAYPIDGFVLRNNVWGLAFSFNGTTFSNARIVNNIGLYGQSCMSGVVYKNNIFTDKKCGSTDRVVGGAMSQFVSPATGDWRLEPGAAAIDAGDRNDYPATDAAGYNRFVGTGPDAGPFEYGAGPDTPGVPPPVAPVTPADPGVAALPGGKTGATRGGDQNGSAAGGDIAETAAVLAKLSDDVRRGRVLAVLDGETLRVRLAGGRRATVRLLGIDAPNRARRGRKARCGARSAASFLRKLTFARGKGRVVRLVGDPRQRERDASGRLLAYVTVAGADLGQRLVKAGYAKTRRTKRPLALRSAYDTAQRGAKAARRGLWRSCAGF